MRPFEIIDDICALHKITRAQLCGKNRCMKYVAVRKALSGILFNAGLNCAQIARMIKRDRTTVHYYIHGKNR